MYFFSLTENREKIANVVEIISRPHLKVVFFGRTSSGKSSVINALLGERVLPSGLGHTTSCFIEVCGTDHSEPGLSVGNGGEVDNGGDDGLLDLPRSLAGFADALRSTALDPKSSLKVYWPRNRCDLLKNNVVLVDSPGIDVEADFDAWIENYCSDADLFVWVMNGESTLMMREKAFFQKVAEKIAKPTILVLVNRWDCAAAQEDEDEEVLSAVHQQHIQRTSEFLVSQLKVAASINEVEKRTFFVSAREILSRPKKQAGPSRFSGLRAREWQRFSTFINDSLVKAIQGLRFIPHADRGILVANETIRLNHNVINSCTEHLADCQRRLTALTEDVDQLESGMDVLTPILKKEILTILAEVGTLFEIGFEAEVLEGMDGLVADFHAASFGDDPITIKVYKEELASFVAEGLNAKLSARVSRQICLNVENAQNCFMDKINSLVPDDKRDFLVDFKPRRMPNDLFSTAVDAKLLGAEFTPDLTFKFSLRPSNLMRQYRRMRKRCVSLDFLSTRQRSLATTTTEVFAAGFISVALLYKCIRWKLLASVGLGYFGVYFFERHFWLRPGAKEAELKRQFRSHAKEVLSPLGPMLTAQCRDTTQKELQSTLVLACGAAEGAGLELKAERDRMEQKTVDLRRAIEHAQDVIECTAEVEVKLKSLRRNLKL